MEEKFDLIIGELKRLNKRMDSFESEMQGVKSQMNSRFEQIDSRFEQIDDRFEQIDGRFKVFETKLDAIASQVAVNTANLQELKERQKRIEVAVMETNENVKQLKAIQDSQHRIIELLSYRSIEQESELKDLKRVK